MLSTAEISAQKRIDYKRDLDNQVEEINKKRLNIIIDNSSYKFHRPQTNINKQIDNEITLNTRAASVETSSTNKKKSYNNKIFLNEYNFNKSNNKLNKKQLEDYDH